MMRIRKFLVVVGLVAVLAVGLLAGRQLEKMGDPDSTHVPGSTESYTLEDIYKRLVSGEDRTKAAFAEPAVAAGTATMFTLDQIMEAAPAQDNDNGATAADVAAGKEFWGLNVTAMEWGLRTGTSTTCATCEGDLSDGERWCDNGDGTVTDMTTGLVWLKDASWCGDYWPWRRDVRCDGDPWACYHDAHHCAGGLYDGIANLSDGSEMGDWRLPTSSELLQLTTGPEAVTFDNMGAFTGVQQVCYWSSSSCGSSFSIGSRYAYCVKPGNLPCERNKADTASVWPVRGP